MENAQNGGTVLPVANLMDILDQEPAFLCLFNTGWAKKTAHFHLLDVKLI